MTIMVTLQRQSSPAVRERQIFSCNPSTLGPKTARAPSLRGSVIVYVVAEAVYDVVVTGAVDAATGELRLAGHVARRLGIPAGRVAEGLATGRFLAATRLDREAAAQLASELEGFGARVSLVASEVAAAARAGAVAASEIGLGPGRQRAEARSATSSLQCPRHGLLYDASVATGCRRCLMEADRDRADPDSPRRLFVGLFLSLLLGFLPAAFYARGPGMSAVRAARAEQVALSAKPATHDVTVAFYQLDDEVSRAFRRTALVTLALWLGIGGAVGGAFARLTAGQRRT